MRERLFVEMSIECARDQSSVADRDGMRIHFEWKQERFAGSCFIVRPICIW